MVINLTKKYSKNRSYLVLHVQINSFITIKCMFYATFIQPYLSQLCTEQFQPEKLKNNKIQRNGIFCFCNCDDHDRLGTPGTGCSCSEFKRRRPGVQFCQLKSIYGCKKNRLFSRESYMDTGNSTGHPGPCFRGCHSGTWKCNIGRYRTEGSN